MKLVILFTIFKFFFVRLLYPVMMVCKGKIAGVKKTKSYQRFK